MVVFPFSEYTVDFSNAVLIIDSTKHTEITVEYFRLPDFITKVYTPFDDKFIIVSAGVRDHYLVGLRNRCPETGTAMNIGFSNIAGSITRADKGSVISPGVYTDTCFIDSITQLEKVRKQPDEK